MKRYSLFFASMLFVIVSACSSQAAQGKPVLRVFTWAEYFSPEVVEAFEEKHNCRVSLDYFDSDSAMYFKLKMSGGYDIITPASGSVNLMAGQGMLLKIDHGLLPNLANLGPDAAKFTDDHEMLYSVPFTRSVSGIGYNRRKVAESDIGSWAIFGNPAYANRMSMLADLRETIGAALKTLGFEANTVDQAEIDQAVDLLTVWKANLTHFANDQANVGLITGELVVAHSYGGDIAAAIAENPDIGFFIPREGATATMDNLVIPADTRQAELAHAFINHILEPAMSAKNMEHTFYYMPNPKALELIPDELRYNPMFNVPEEDLEKCEYLRNLGEDNAKYFDAWDRIRTN